MAESELRELLLIDEDPTHGRVVSTLLARAGWRVRQVRDSAAALALLQAQESSAAQAIMIGQRQTEKADEANSLAILCRSRPDLPVILIAAANTAEFALAALRAGASDYLAKPITSANLVTALESAVDCPVGELRPLSEKISAPLGFEEIVGAAPGFRTALAIAAKAARARVPVLIEGESGVGKELFAHAIHNASSRSRRPMVIVNCRTIPANLVESELFGHEKGAFTGAFDRHVGRLVDADGSSVFLDEIDALPPEAQVKLMRLLQTGEIEPLGAGRTKIVDVRVIAAANRRLAGEVAAGRFREDLFCGLNVVQIAIPSLRERQGDIPHLVRHFLDYIGAATELRTLNIDEDALQLLMRYDWPGNVRQLQNVLLRAVAWSNDTILTRADFPQIAASIPSEPAPQPTGMEKPRVHLAPLNAPAPVSLFDTYGHIRPLDDIEADVIRLAIGHYRGRMTEVARRLGIGRSTLYRKLAELGISDAA